MSLTALPTELIELISSNLDLVSFHNTRLTCSLLRQRSLHSFRDLFFQSKSIPWTREDLDRLVSIASHPDLGSALKTLIIDATPRRSILLWQLDKRIRDQQRDARDGSSASAAEWRSLKQQYVDLERETRSAETFFNETRYDQKRLKAAFDLLRHRGTLNSLIFKYEGIVNFWNRPLRDYCLFVQQEMSRPFISAISAIAASGVCIKTISLHDTNSHGAVSVGRLETLGPSLPGLDLAFSKLTTLQLNIRDWRSSYPGFEVGSDRPPFMMRFLNKARSVKHLALSGHTSFDADMFGDMARHCRFDSLESCELSVFEVTAATDLLALLHHSSNTLQHLSLRFVALCDPTTTWADLLERVATTPTLLPAMTRLQVLNLYNEAGRRVTLGASRESHVVLGSAGQAGWREALQEMAAEAGSEEQGPSRANAAALYGFL